MIVVWSVYLCFSCRGMLICPSSTRLICWKQPVISCSSGSPEWWWWHNILQDSCHSNRSFDQLTRHRVLLTTSLKAVAATETCALISCHDRNTVIYCPCAERMNLMRNNDSLLSCILFTVFYGILDEESNSSLLSVGSVSQYSSWCARTKDE